MISTAVIQPPVSVLVVDDDLAQREMMAELLQVEGFAPITAQNGAEALAQLRTGVAVRVILLDLMMPVMDGWAFLRAQRQDPALAHIPVVLTTAETHSQTSDVQADEVFAKPLDVPELMKCVRGLCVQGRVPGSAR